MSSPDDPPTVTYLISGTELSRCYWQRDNTKVFILTMGPFQLMRGSQSSLDAEMQSSAGSADLAYGHTSQPIVTGSSVLGIQCVDGVVLATDTLASYGSLARFRNVQRVHRISSHCAVGIGGDVSDQQELLTLLDKLTTGEYCSDDGYTLSPRALYAYLSRVMYNRRNKMDPLWNSVLFAGFDAEAGPTLGMVDMHGAHFESNVIATGFGLHMGLPLLRKAWRSDLSVAEAVPIVEDIMKVLFYRDARTIDRIQTAVVSADGVKISPAKSLDTKWDHKAFIIGSRAGGDESTW